MHCWIPVYPYNYNNGSDCVIVGVTLPFTVSAGGSVSFAERNLDTARVVFQKAVKTVYAIEDDKEIKPELEYKEYEVGDRPEKFQFKK